MSTSGGATATPPLWCHLVSGFGAGVAATVVLHPIDLVKVRLQAQEGASTSGSGGRAPHAKGLPQYRGTVHALRTIVRVEGWRGLYSGLLPSAIGSSVSWGLYFFAYNHAKERWHASQGGADLEAWQHLVSAAEAGAVVSLLTNPIWVLKTRLQLQPGGGMKPSAALRARADAHAGRERYLGLYNAAQSVWAREGIGGFYRGIWASLLLVSHGAFKFMAYEGLSRWVREQHVRGAGADDPVAPLSSLEISSIGAASKLFATAITYPTQVVRTRLQQRSNTTTTTTSGGSGRDKGLRRDLARGSAMDRAPRYKDTASAFRLIYVREGLAGFYKGMVPNVLRTTPQAAIMFLAYEKIMQALTGGRER